MTSWLMGRKLSCAGAGMEFKNENNWPSAATLRL